MKKHGTKILSEKRGSASRGENKMLLHSHRQARTGRTTSHRWGPALGQQATIYVYHPKDQQVATGTTAAATVAAAAPGAAVVAAAAGAVFADGGGVQCSVIVVVISEHVEPLVKRTKEKEKKKLTYGPRTYQSVSWAFM